MLANPDPNKAREIEIKITRRQRKHLGNPKFKELSERLDALKKRFESGQINSVKFLKQLLVIARETLQAEKKLPLEEDEDRGKAALTELFNEVRTDETPSLSKGSSRILMISFGLCAFPAGKIRWLENGKLRRLCVKRSLSTNCMRMTSYSRRLTAISGNTTREFPLDMRQHMPTLRLTDSNS